LVSVCLHYKLVLLGKDPLAHDSAGMPCRPELYILVFSSVRKGHRQLGPQCVRSHVRKGCTKLGCAAPDIDTLGNIERPRVATSISQVPPRLTL
jgi:hypothetical protein